MLRAIDLYSGVGGWSLGLAMAGIEVIASFEWWQPAAETNRINNGLAPVVTDIRNLDLDTLPGGIDIVVGSPPCTQFSFSNRGGNGDIEDGLRDVAAFLRVVRHVSPRFWAMENVPRVAGILEKSLEPGGPLEQYADLRPRIEVIDMSEWGLPQRRKRCIAGRFDFERLLAYRGTCLSRSLGDVVDAYRSPKVTDPVYRVPVAKGRISDHVLEAPLNWEEERMNREMKTFHPVYNDMSFPDLHDRAARTVTATCTRVSRESIVIPSGGPNGGFRRLTVRERASLQGFPSAFVFSGTSYTQKLKMVGNALPPLFGYYVGCAMEERDPRSLPDLRKAIRAFSPDPVTPQESVPETGGKRYAANRSFRAAIPGLRFKSGVRFEFANQPSSTSNPWTVRFFYGNSKNVTEVAVDPGFPDEILGMEGTSKVRLALDAIKVELNSALRCCLAGELQETWTHRGQGKHPYEVVDLLGSGAHSATLAIVGAQLDAATLLDDLIPSLHGTTGWEKVVSHAPAVLSGLFIGGLANSHFSSCKTPGIRMMSRKTSCVLDMFTHT